MSTQSSCCTQLPKCTTNTTEPLSSAVTVIFIAWQNIYKNTTNYFALSHPTKNIPNCYAATDNILLVSNSYKANWNTKNRPTRNRLMRSVETLGRAGNHLGMAVGRNLR